MMNKNKTKTNLNKVKIKRKNESVTEKKDKNIKKPSSDCTPTDEQIEKECKAILPKSASKTLESCAKDVENDSDVEMKYVDVNKQPLKDYTHLEVQPSHEDRPIIVSPNGTVFLECFSRFFRQAQDFLIAIAEPVSRPDMVHEYKITSYSLYAAVSVGLTTYEIVKTLRMLSKVKVCDELINFINECTLSYGKVKLVLRKNLYIIETESQVLYNKLLKDKVISKYMVKSDYVDIVQEKTVVKEKNVDDLEDEEDFDKSSFVISIRQDRLEKIQQRCIELDFPLLAEYDFRSDNLNPDLPINLKSNTSLRPYQECCLRKLFSNRRARSGIIVLPCGAGKTLVGVTATCTLKKSCLVLCTSSVAVEQWKSQYKIWSTADDKVILRFTSDSKDRPPPDGKACICISTYSMISFQGKRAWNSQQIIKWVNSQEWGLLIMDEVQYIPAKMFRRVLTTVKCHCKLGLTATLVREDDKITDLNFLIGPKLYEANWKQLQNRGYIARVQCSEVSCPMSPEFFKEYANATSRRATLFYLMNPNKFRACEYLIKYHEKRGDKIIVFSDSVFVLKKYAIFMDRPYLYGPTGLEERLRILKNFQHNPNLNTIFVSKVADNSFDLPEANVLIQISSHGGSRRQEAQRMGRILRAKKQVILDVNDYNAYFYSLVSMDTVEVYHARKRQRFLVNQGYAYKYISYLQGLEEDETLRFSTQEERNEVLQQVINVHDNHDDDVELASDEDPNFQKKTVSLSSVSASGKNLYGEFSKSNNKRSKLEKRKKKEDKVVHPLFKMLKKS